MNIRRVIGWVYIFRLSHKKFKIGVSYDTDKRERDLEEGLGENIDLSLRMFLLAPYQMEKIMHKIFHVFNSPLSCKDCGRTEWFADYLGIVRFAADLFLLFIAVLQLSVIFFIIYKFNVYVAGF